MANRKRTTSKRKKVLMALSGGIDSAVSAYLLLKQGYEVEAAFMKNWSSTEGLLKNDCPWLQDRQDALRVAAFLRIPMHTLDFENEYQRRVMDYFFKEYEKGRTPNPDVMCNKEIKFKLLYDWAMARGFDFLATGHYAQIAFSGQRSAEGVRSTLNAPASALPSGETGQRCMLVRSKDEFKDQTYFIYNISPKQLPHILFPVGGMKKGEVKALAKKIGLPNVGKKESMGLCFVGKVRLKDFLEQKLREKPGKIVDQNGNAIGQHPGLHHYTIGQRQGIKVGATGPYYVFKKDLAANTLHVTNDPEDKRLETKEVELHSVNWIDKAYSGQRTAGSSKPPLNAPASALPSGETGQRSTLSGRYRHQGELVPLVINQIDESHYRVVFKKPQKAVASGQSLVLYKGKECVGGGVIA